MQLFSLAILLLSSTVILGDHDEADLIHPGIPDTCLAGPFHKETPSPEEDTFSECLSWQNSSCCNVALSESISMHKALGLYNYSWDVCNKDRPLSQECEVFIKDEECFYQCEPMLGYFETEPGSGYITGVPVCADYCERWFEACRNDLTCVENWLFDFDFDEHGYNSCPENSSCVTFEEMYTNAAGLCNRMWGTAFHYSTDAQNCTVMAFDSSMSNPNTRLTFPSNEPATTLPATTAAALLPRVNNLLLLLLIVSAFTAF